MRTLRSALLVLAFPLVSMGFYSNPLITEVMPDGSVLVRNQACTISLNAMSAPATVPAFSTGHYAWFQASYTGPSVTVTAQAPSGTGNVTNLTNPAATFTMPSGGTDMEVHFDAGAVNNSNSVTGSWSAPCGGWNFTTNKIRIVP